jgi:hypothetical protein
MPGMARLFKEFVKRGCFDFVNLSQRPQSLPSAPFFSSTVAEAIYHASDPLKRQHVRNVLLRGERARSLAVEPCAHDAFCRIRYRFGM